MVYIQADGSLAAGMLYLRGGPEHRDDHWMMVDKGTGCRCGSTPHSARQGVPWARRKRLDRPSARGLRLEI